MALLFRCQSCVELLDFGYFGQSFYDPTSSSSTVPLPLSVMKSNLSLDVVPYVFNRPCQACATAAFVHVISPNLRSSSYGRRVLQHKTIELAMSIPSSLV